MNPELALLQPYPFEKLAALKGQLSPPVELPHIALSIGEPKHQPPRIVQQAIIDNIDKLGNYPTTKGMLELRKTIAQWLTTRFKLNADTVTAEHHVLPVNGTREALFAFTQAIIDRRKKPLVISPNPFYQIYEGAAFLAGAEPHFLACSEDNGFIPDFDSVSDETWERCQLLFLCSPGNPTGAVIDNNTYKKLLTLADQFDFIIASDECYSELYFDEQHPPTGLLSACAEAGRDDYRRCVVFHSLSKRSNLPGLRSGFVAGDANVLKQFLHYRTYHGCAMPIQHQLASIAAWSDEHHVKENRDQYRLKFDAVLSILGEHLAVDKPDAGFYLWPKTPIPDTDFAQQLYSQQNITVLPGQYIARTIDGHNPGDHRIRMALVAPLAQCVESAERIKRFVTQL